MATATTIPASCRVSVNGALAGRDTLAVSDAFLVAVSDVSGDPFVLNANRVAIEGTVAGTTTTYPGPVYRVTVDLKAGGSKTYVMNLAGGIAFPSKGDVVKYGLDFDGAVYVPVGYESLTPYVVCTQYVVDGSGNATATFDVRGLAVTYKVTANFSGYAEDQDYLWLDVHTDTGTVDGYYEIYPDDNWLVVSVDATNGTMTLQSESTYIFIDDPDLVVYENGAAGRIYIGLAGLKVGDGVYYDTDNEEPVFELDNGPE